MRKKIGLQGRVGAIQLLDKLIFDHSDINVYQKVGNSGELGIKVEDTIRE